MRKKMLWALFLLFVALPSTTFAMGECKDDRQKFCASAGMDQDKIKQCLKDNYKDLSPACKALIDQKIEQKLENQSK